MKIKEIPNCAVNFKSKLGRVIKNPKLLRSLTRRIKPNQYEHCITMLSLINEEPKTFIDIGAFVGEYSKSFEKIVPNIKIYSFEPLRNSADNIILLNGEVFNFALWNKEDEAIFYENTIDGRASSFNISGNSFSYKVKRKRFDSLNINIEQPCICKIDVERSEMEVLEGMGEKLNEIDVLQVEVYFYPKQTDFAKLFFLLSKYKFNGFIQKSLRREQEYHLCDLIFYKKK